MSDSKVRQLLAGIEARAAVDSTGWSAAERSAELIELLELREELQAVIVEKVTQLARRTGTP